LQLVCSYTAKPWSFIWRLRRISQKTTTLTARVKKHQTAASTIIHVYVISKVDGSDTVAKRPDRHGTRPRQRQFFVGREGRIQKTSAGWNKPVSSRRLPYRCTTNLRIDLRPTPILNNILSSTRSSNETREIAGCQMRNGRKIQTFLTPFESQRVRCER